MLTNLPTGKAVSLAPGGEAVCLSPLWSASQAFERQVRSTPDATAVTFSGQAYSYAWLDMEASSLAHRLASLGVGPDCLVGVALERSVEMI
ncbi:MAG: AMP-binding protein, partial [Pirellulales bacterium]